MRKYFIVLFLTGMQAAPVQAQEAFPDAFLDPQAAVLVAGARSATDSANALIEGYDVVARQRFTAGVRIVGRERPVYRQEVAARIEWRKGGAYQVEVLGGREAAPIIRTGVAVPEDLVDEASDLVFDPTELPLLSIGGRNSIGGSNTEADEAEGEANGNSDGMTIIHPLARGSEAHYRFQSGETITIRLQDGRTVRLLELRVIPRRSSSRLMSGSFWLEEGTFSAVRGVFTLATPLRVVVPPRGSRAPFPAFEVSFDIRHVAIEYGLWGNEWWMPRLVSFEGSGRAGAVTGSMVYERRYEDYRIQAREPPGPFTAPDSVAFDLVGKDCEDATEPCRNRVVLVPRDSSYLLRSPHLPASIYATEGRLADDGTLEELARLVDRSTRLSLARRPPRWHWIPVDMSLVRYNRVEGGTIGTSGRVEFEPLSVSASIWTGSGARTPSGQAAFTHSRYSGQEGVEVYRRLEAFTPQERPFALGNSISAFLFGRDDGDYYRSEGTALSLRRETRTGADLEIRGYLERQRPVETSSRASVPYWTDGREFRDNPAADRADQVGLESTIGLGAGLNPAGVRFLGEVNGSLERGTYDFARGAARGYLSFPLPGPLVGAIQAVGGTSAGNLPLQRRWVVGGSSTVRGFSPEERISGESFWSARGEIGSERPGARIVLFTDAGNASPRDKFSTDAALVSVGIGLSALDGLFRLDAARAVRGGTGWSVQLRLDGPL